nr:MAG TPA: hypothetical protein [Caudoviricetes sp.]
MGFFFCPLFDCGAGVVVLFRAPYPLPPIRPPMRSDVIPLYLYRSALLRGSVGALGGLPVISLQHCYCCDVL